MTTTADNGGSSQPRDVARYLAMTEDSVGKVWSIIDALGRVGEAIGSWTGDVNVTEKGVTYRASFAKRSGVQVGVEWASQVEQAPSMLADACRKLLAADAEVKRLSLALIEAQNPGIDVEKVRADRGW